MLNVTQVVKIVVIIAYRLCFKMALFEIELRLLKLLKLQVDECHLSKFFAQPRNYFKFNIINRRSGKDSQAEMGQECGYRRRASDNEADTR